MITFVKNTQVKEEGELITAFDSGTLATRIQVLRYNWTAYTYTNYDICTV